MIHVRAEFIPSTATPHRPTRWVVTVEGIVDSSINLSPPRVDGLTFRFHQRAFHTQFINDKSLKSTVLTFSATPQRSDVFTVPPTEITVGDQIFVVPSTTLMVEDHPSSSFDSPEKTRTAFFELNYRRPGEWFVGQSVPAELILYVDTQVRGQVTSVPIKEEGDHFSATRLTMEPEKTTESVNGHTYSKLVWKSLLTPMKSGSSSLKFGLDLTLELPSRSPTEEDDNPFDIFHHAFGSFLKEQRPVKLETSAEKISILPLPLDLDSQEPNGGVGRFTLGIPQVLEKEAIANESLTYVVELKGSGTFDTLKEPTLVFDEKRWRHYAPKTVFEPEDEVGYRGKVRYEYILVPLASGESVPLPEIHLRYFDPIKKAYQTAVANAPQPINVKPALPTKRSTGHYDKGSVSTPEPPPEEGLPHQEIQLKASWVPTNRPKALGQVSWPIALLWLLYLSYEGYRYRRRTDKNSRFVISLKKRLKTHLRESSRWEQKDPETYLHHLQEAVQLSVALRTGSIDGPLHRSFEEIDELLRAHGDFLSPSAKETLRKLLEAHHQIKFGGGLQGSPVSPHDVKQLFAELEV
ncbi:MAG: BatD family protein [Puniceicoccales bacterium]|jgi:hypothetical protein|nr:BatD family protein [Puniceicoccales bacterium]